jgi:hypothetical protein
VLSATNVFFPSSPSYEKCQEQILGMCLKVCTRFQTFAQLVTMDFFMPVVDLCLGKKKVTVCKVVFVCVAAVV